MMGFFEEIEIGAERRLGEHAFTEAAIIAFAREYDPQRFHVDAEAAKDSMFGGLCASGWHVAAAAMRAIVDSRTPRPCRARRRGEPLPPLGVSPGVENLRWPNPTRPGDVVTYFSVVTGKRETKRPQWGLVFMRTWGVNQDGARGDHHGEPRLHRPPPGVNVGMPPPRPLLRERAGVRPLIRICGHLPPQAAEGPTGERGLFSGSANTGQGAATPRNLRADASAASRYAPPARRQQRRTAERLAQALQPAHQIDRGADGGEVEPVGGADVAPEDFAEMQRGAERAAALRLRRRAAR